MIDRKDLKVGLVTEEGREVIAMGNERLLYVRDNIERAAYIDSFCSSCSIKKEKVEIVRWVNVYPDDYFYSYPTKSAANHYADPKAIAVAVKLVGSYEV